MAHRVFSAFEHFELTFELRVAAPQQLDDRGRFEMPGSFVGIKRQPVRIQERVLRERLEFQGVVVGRPYHHPELLDQVHFGSGHRKHSYSSVLAHAGP